MKLISCHVENFGRLRGFDHIFAEGLNTFFYENGWGKSTFAAFLCAMLYGLPASRKKQASENLRERYRPWQGGVYGGTLLFEVRGKMYEITRTFGKKESEDVFALYDPDTGLPSPDYSSEIGKELFFLDRDSFLRTAFTAQQDCETAPTDDINALIADLADRAGDMGSYENAIRHLREAVGRLSPNRQSGSLCRRGEEIRRLERETAGGKELEEEIRLSELAYTQAEQTAVSLEKQLELFAREEADIVRAAQDRQRQREKDLLAAAERLSQREKEEELVQKNASAHRLWLSLCETRRRRGKQVEEAAAFFRVRVPSQEEIRDQLDRCREMERLEDRMQQGMLSDREQRRLTELEEKLREVPPEKAGGEAARAGWRPDAAEPGRAGRKANAAEPGRTDRKTNAGEPGRAGREVNTGKPRHAGRRPVSFGIPGSAWLCLAAGILLLAGAAAFLAMHHAAAGAAASAGGLLCLLFPLCCQMLRRTETADASAKRGARSPSSVDMAPAEEREDGTAKRGARSPSSVDMAPAEEREDGTAKRGARSYASVDMASAGEREDGSGSSGTEELARARAREYAWLTEKEQMLEKNHARWTECRRPVVRFLLELGFSPQEDLRAQLEELRDRADAWEDAQALLHEASEDLLAFEAQMEREGIRYREDAAEDTREDADSVQILKNVQKSSASTQTAGDEREDTALRRQLDELRRKTEETREELRQCRTLATERSRELEALREAQEIREEDLAQLEILRARQAAEEAEHRQILHAADCLKRAREAVTSRHADPVRAGFGRCWEMITGYSAAGIYVDARSGVTMEELGGRRDPSFFSTGYKDLTGICLRAALADAMYPPGRGERPPLILDDPFASLDDEKMKGALRFLRKLSGEYQILYFTCSRSRQPGQ